jgi:hypothetical protein
LQTLDALLRSLQVGFQRRRLCFQRVDDSRGLRKRRFRLFEFGSQAFDLRLRLVDDQLCGRIENHVGRLDVALCTVGQPDARVQAIARQDLELGPALEGSERPVAGVRGLVQPEHQPVGHITRLGLRHHRQQSECPEQPDL